MGANALDKVRRVVTGHSHDGRAVIRSDDLYDIREIPLGGALFSLLWTSPTVPVDNNDETDGRERDAALTLHGGSVIRVVDFMPGCVSPMHRTNSLDYGIVLSGQVELALDDGATTLLGPGDVCVQRGTMHLWRNPSTTDYCRVVFVLTEAQPYRHGDLPLPEVQP